MGLGSVIRARSPLADPDTFRLRFSRVVSCVGFVACDISLLIFIAYIQPWSIAPFCACWCGVHKQDSVGVDI